MSDQASTLALLEALRSRQAERHLTADESVAAGALAEAIMKRRLQELQAEKIVTGPPSPPATH